MDSSLLQLQVLNQKKALKSANWHKAVEAKEPVQQVLDRVPQKSLDVIAKFVSDSERVFKVIQGVENLIENEHLLQKKK